MEEQAGIQLLALIIQLVVVVAGKRVHSPRGRITTEVEVEVLRQEET
jgi:hypothetical protein